MYITNPSQKSEAMQRKGGGILQNRKQEVHHLTTSSEAHKYRWMVKECERPFDEMEQNWMGWKGRGGE